MSFLLVYVGQLSHAFTIFIVSKNYKLIFSFIESQSQVRSATPYLGLCDRQNGFGGNTGNLVTENCLQISAIHHAGKLGFCGTGSKQIGGLHMPLDLFLHRQFHKLGVAGHTQIPIRI
jgi:hypothetical protein